MSLLLLLCVNGVVSGTLGIHWAKPGVDSFLCMFASVAVFVVECIRRDAYFTVKQTPRSGILIFTIGFGPLIPLLKFEVKNQLLHPVVYLNIQ